MNLNKDDDHYKVVVLNEMDKDGYMVFQKVIQDESEFRFYNPEHFASIGFPDAIITVVGNNVKERSSDLNITGGYYAKPEELTWPFRQFVYLIQTQKPEIPDKNTKESNNTPYISTTRPSDGANEDKRVFSGLNGFAQKITDLLKPKKPVEIKSNNLNDAFSHENHSETKPATELPILDANIEKDTNKDNEQATAIPELARVEGDKPVNMDATPPPETTPSEREELKVIVKIPVVGNVDDLSEVSKRELLLERERLSIEGSIYKIGKREIRMCEKVKEKEEIKRMCESQKNEKTKGTKMEKYKNLEKILTESRTKNQEY